MMQNRHCLSNAKYRYQQRKNKNISIGQKNLIGQGLILTSKAFSTKSHFSKITLQVLESLGKIHIWCCQWTLGIHFALVSTKGGKV